MTQPFLIEGALYCDDRGQLSCINELDMSQFKRFYTVSNHRQGFIRAWHGHMHESKAVMCLSGAALVGAVSLDGKDTIYKTVLCAEKSQAWYIPSGFANGFKTLTQDCKLMFFSNKTLDQSKSDDIRYPWDQWDIWAEDFR